jgi:hypothetical protein
MVGMAMSGHNDVDVVLEWQSRDIKMTMREIVAFKRKLKGEVGFVTLKVN